MRSALAVALALLAAACGRHDDAQKAEQPPGSDDATALVGDWSTGCLADASTETRAFAGDAMTLTYTSYAAAGCQTPASTQVQSGTFAIGAYDPANDVTALDLTVASVVLTLHSADLVAEYDRAHVCGGDWQLGVPRELAQGGCGPNESGAFDVFRLEGDTLYFGQKDADRTGHAAEARPITVDLARPFKQS
jgi:hypothetical protein